MNNEYLVIVENMLDIRHNVESKIATETMYFLCNTINFISFRLRVED